jgi:hypothetical protein
LGRGHRLAVALDGAIELLNLQPKAIRGREVSNAAAGLVDDREPRPRVLAGAGQIFGPRLGTSKFINSGSKRGLI